MKGFLYRGSTVTEFVMKLEAYLFHLQIDWSGQLILTFG